MVIAIDFDGTLCERAWPGIGRPRADIVLRAKQARQGGAKLILWTCREGELLEEALRWCEALGLRFDAVNENLPERTALYGNDCRKVDADEYWDDKAVPLEERSCDSCRRMRPTQRKRPAWCANNCRHFEPRG